MSKEKDDAQVSFFVNLILSLIILFWTFLAGALVGISAG